ncbi:MAG TPA: HAD family phosphatase [Candidatus Saccharibacteria bacterium]|nr:HAD family phosphatase [Candidatus Saccharibacteria bacterium]HRQ98190.1 HAD family phosphatase [Candidatus Saccharibacteria bacterium]
MIKAIIFDFFGVIRTDSYQTWLNTNHIPREGGYFEASRQSDLGKINSNQFLKLISKLTKRNVTQSEMHANVRIDSDVITIVNKLKQHYKIAMLSNSPADSINGIIDDNNLRQYFDEIIVSGEIGMVKPNPEIFEYTLNKLAVKPDEVIFIDDSSTNTDAAEKLGIKSIQFTSAEQLKHELNKIQITV